MKSRINNEDISKLKTFQNKRKKNKHFKITFFKKQNVSTSIKEKKYKKLYKCNTKYI